MKTLAAILLVAVTFATVSPSTASAGDVDKWIRMGLSMANNAKTAKKVVNGLQNNDNNKPNTLLGRLSQNQQPARKLLRRR